MAGSKTIYLSKKLLDLPVGGQAYSAPLIYVGLWTSTVDDTATGSTAGEASYTGYTRVQVTNNLTNFPAATGTTTASKSNANAITFPTSTGGSSSVTYVGVCDASSGGNMLYWTDCTATTINSGDTPQIVSTALAFVED